MTYFQLNLQIKSNHFSLLYHRYSFAKFFISSSLQDNIASSSVFRKSDLFKGVNHKAQESTHLLNKGPICLFVSFGSLHLS